MDFTGPYAPFHCYCFLIVDCFAKYLWGRIMYSKEADKVAAVLEDIFEQEGIPEEVLILQYDNGTEFKGAVTPTLEKWGVTSM
jgi:transposase InsO family protein